MVPRLDLHGVKHEDVQKVCDSFMTQIWGRCEEAVIIKGNSSSMKYHVREALRDYDLEIKSSLSSNAALRVVF